MISTEKRQATISTARRHASDSGSPEVQVSLLTERITSLSEHLQSHHKDMHSKRGLVQMVNKRNKLLKYLARAERDRYTDLIGRLGLRK